MSVSSMLREAEGNNFYLLMNKNRPIYKFRFTNDNAIQVLDIYERPPFWIKDLQEWIAGRNAAKHRHEIKKLLSDNNAESLKGFVLFTRCFSLNDTLWVKWEEDSLKWEDLNPYTNPFRESLGLTLVSGPADTSDPSLSTDGQFPKCWVRRDGKPYLLKLAYTGYEPYGEVLASNIPLSCAKVVGYILTESQYVPATLCENFCTETVSFLPYRRVKDNFTLEETSRYYESIGCLKEFNDMLLLDALSINVDRHHGNFGILIDSDTYEVLGMSPLYDMNWTYGLNGLANVRKPIQDLLAAQSSRRFGDFIEALRGRVNKDSIELVDSFISYISHEGIVGIPEDIFERMITISKIQLKRVKEIL